MEKRALTLIEIMVVIFIITLISGVVGYNLKGSMDKGRAFKTEQGIEQLHNLLLICLAEGTDINEIREHPDTVLKRAELAKDPSKLVLDGWNQPYAIEIADNGNDIKITSQNLVRYNRKHGR